MSFVICIKRELTPNFSRLRPSKPSRIRTEATEGDAAAASRCAPANGEASAQNAIRQCILDAYTHVETNA
jgi:hypothetical protein